MPLETHPIFPTAESLRFLWERFSENAKYFPQGFVADPIAFTCWLANKSSLVIGVGPLADPLGVFVFTDITPDDFANAHILIWKRHAAPHEDLVAAGRTACASVMRSFRLHRIATFMPVSNVPARAFAEQVGFVKEGRPREAMITSEGYHEDAWMLGLLASDLARVEGDILKQAEDIKDAFVGEVTVP